MSSTQLRHAEPRHPAGDALAQRHREHLGGLVGVDGPVAQHRDRDEHLAPGAIDADVLVLDELAQLGRDRVADGADVVEPRQPGPQPLDRLQLGRPGRHPSEGPRRPDGDGRVARERLRGVDVHLAPPVRSGRGRDTASRAARGRRPAAHRGACRRPPGSPPPGAGCRSAPPPARAAGPGRRGGMSRCPTRASSTLRASARNCSEKPIPPGEETRPSGSRRITATRSAPNRTRAWSLRSRTTSPTSSLEARSVATRRSASDRRRRPDACSAAAAPRMSTPSVRAIAPARRRPSSWPSCIGARQDQHAPGRLATRDADDQLVRAQAEHRGGAGQPGPRVDGGGRLEGEREQRAPGRHACGSP